jgi:outer membrane lipoprotein-sorting protein
MLQRKLHWCMMGLVTVSLLLPCVGANAAAPAQLTAAQIVEKNIAARGGLAAWHNVQTLTMKGQMDAGKGVKLPYLFELKRPGKQRLEIQFNGQTAIQVYDGSNGWKLRPFLNRKQVEIFTPEEMKQQSMESELDGPLVDYAAKGTRVEADGIDKVEGKDAYKLKLTLKNGIVRHLWVDAQSFLEVKIDGTRRMDGKPRPIETYYRDYRNVQGLQIPFLYETAVQNVKGTEKIEIEKVEVNPALADSQFAKLQ